MNTACTTPCRPVLEKVNKLAVACHTNTNRFVNNSNNNNTAMTTTTSTYANEVCGIFQFSCCLITSILHDVSDIGTGIIRSLGGKGLKVLLGKGMRDATQVDRKHLCTCLFFWQRDVDASLKSKQQKN